jgi:plasmid segregation protein ParM
MNSNIEVIGIDHGWSQMKTSNTCFNTSIKELANAPAFHDNVLEYGNRYFAVGEDRLEVLDSKVENENFYLLTLVAIAKELQVRGKSEADVVLAVGLPLTRFSAERKPFIDYLAKNEDVVFGFEQRLYKVHIQSVSVYPQCYAAVAGMLSTFGKKALVVDVGSWTVDSMLIVNKRPDNSKCDTQNEGLIRCMREINRVAVQVKNRKIDEADIQEYMQTGKTELPKDFKAIMDQQIQKFVDKVYRYQTECGYSLDMIPVYFVGGGAVVMRNFGRYQQPNIHYVLDVKANAKGFETMARIALKSGR